MKIIQISTATAVGGYQDTVYGLGDDGKVYYWDWTLVDWVLFRHPETRIP